MGSDNQHCTECPVLASVGCRWLLAQGRPEEAEAVLLTIARGNGVTAKLDIALQRPAATASCAPGAAESVSALVTQPRLLLVSLILGYCWFVVGGCYYGLTLGTPHNTQRPEVTGIMD